MDRTSPLFLPARAARRLGAALEGRLRFERHAAAVRPPRSRAFQVEPPSREALRSAGLDVRPLPLDLDDFRRYLRAARYRRHPLYCLSQGGPAALGGASGRLQEKALEHYLAARLLDLGPGDLYVDIASGGSPAAAIYRRLYRCRALRQDRDFPPGLRGDRLGGDAGRLALADGSVSKLGLHCSFEHFEGDEDVRFLREAARVLRPGGRLCIAPLYLHREYTIVTDPVLLSDGGRAFDADAVLCCVRGWGGRHGRLYDLPHLLRRVRDSLRPLSLVLYEVEGAAAAHPGCYLRHVAVAEKPR